MNCRENRKKTLFLIPPSEDGEREGRTGGRGQGGRKGEGGRQGRRARAKQLLVELNHRIKVLSTSVKCDGSVVVRCSVEYQRKEISVFPEQKGSPMLQFANGALMSDCCFLIDITEHMNPLNEHLQGREHLIHELFEFIFRIRPEVRPNVVGGTNAKRQTCLHFPTMLVNKPINQEPTHCYC